jgi:hypothetical protein
MPVCNAATFYASACLGYTCISPKQRKAIMMRAMILELQALGGPDYRTDITALNDAVAKLRELKPEQVQAALAGVYLANATEAGATVPTTVNALLADSQCYTCLNDDLDHFLLELICQLGAHAPQ